ncbi:MAG: hypothetical protein ACWGQW_03325 [bacterium]
MIDGFSLGIGTLKYSDREGVWEVHTTIATYPVDRRDNRDIAPHMRGRIVVFDLSRDMNAVIWGVLDRTVSRSFLPGHPVLTKL